MSKHVLFWLLLIVGLVACNGSGKDSPSGSNDPAALLESAAAKLDEAQNFQLALAISGTPVLLSTESIGGDITLSVESAEGTFVRPDALEATVTVKLDDIPADLNLIVIGPDQYLRQTLLTFGNWQALQFSPDFNPATLVTGDESIAAALRSVTNLEFVGQTDLDGLAVYHIRGQVQAERVRAVTVGLIGTSSGAIQADFYIRQRDGLLEQMVLNEPNGTIWTIGLYGYNGDYTITRPTVAP